MCFGLQGPISGERRHSRAPRGAYFEHLSNTSSTQVLDCSNPSSCQSNSRPYPGNPVLTLDGDPWRPGRWRGAPATPYECALAPPSPPSPRVVAFRPTVAPAPPGLSLVTQQTIPAYRTREVRDAKRRRPLYLKGSSTCVARYPPKQVMHMHMSHVRHAYQGSPAGGGSAASC